MAHHNTILLSHHTTPQLFGLTLDQLYHILLNPLHPSTISNNNAPATMYFPLSDPFIISGLVLSGAIVIILILLLVVTQRRSAREVWGSVENPDRKARLAAIEADNDTYDTDTLLTISETASRASGETRLDVIPKGEQDHEDLPEEVDMTEVERPRAVRFSSRIERLGSLASPYAGPGSDTMSATFDVLYDDFHRRSNGFEADLEADLEAGPSRGWKRRSACEQQFEEMHLMHPAQIV